MTIQSTFISLAAAGAALSLMACESAGEASPAGAATVREAVNPSCRPGDTPAGTASGLRCTTGSVTGQWPGIDANVEGAATYGQSIAPPTR